jgi:hypothetical protein
VEEKNRETSHHLIPTKEEEFVFLSTVEEEFVFS